MKPEILMTTPVPLGGSFQPSGTDLRFNRFGYGAIRLAGEMAYGPPADRDRARSVVRRAVKLGINHIDTSDYYGPHVANQIIREALHPYPDDLIIVTKVGARRGPDRSWPEALSRDDLVGAVHDNLRNLGVDALDVVNLRVGTPFSTNEDSIAEPLGVLAELQNQGLIKHIGLSNVSVAQVRQAQSIAPIVCVQNRYNVAFRHDDPLIDMLARLGTAYVPFHPLGGFQPLESSVLEAAAAAVGATTRQVALAWMLQRSPNILVIAGTSSLEHLEANVAASAIVLPADVVAQLDQVQPQQRLGRPPVSGGR